MAPKRRSTPRHGNIKDRVTAPKRIWRQGPSARPLRAGREADGAILNWLSPDDVARVVPFVHAGGPDKEIVARIFLCPSEDTERARAIGRFANFFATTAGSFDAGPAGWSFEDVDFAYLRAPYLAGRQDADAAMRLLLEDFAHYAALRKPRRGEDATLVFDEFSAIAGGREAAIQLVERVRDAGCALYLSAQSADGLGDEAQQRRLVAAALRSPLGVRRAR